MKKESPLLSIFITVFIDLLGVGIIIPVFAPLIVGNQHGMMSAETSDSVRNIIYGLLTATFPFFQFFGAPILGALSDKYGRKQILNFTLFGTLVGYILFALAIHFKILWLLFFARAIPGFMGGNISIVLASLADVSKPEDRAKNFGLVGMAFGLGFILGPFLGGILSSKDICPYFEYATPLWFTALLTLVNIYYVKKQFPDLHKGHENEVHLSLLAGFKNIRKAFQIPSLQTVFLTLFLYSFGFSFFMQFFQVYLYNKFGFTEKNIGLIFGYVGIWIAFTQGVINRKFAGQFRSEKILRFSLIGLSIFLIQILLPDSWYWLLLNQPFVAICSGLSQPNLTGLVSTLTPPEKQGEMLGIQQSVQSFAFIFPPLIAGFAVTTDIRLPIFLASLTVLLAWIVFVLRFKRA